MKKLADLVAIGLLVACSVALALVSVQNAQPVAIVFLGAQSIQLPFGLLLSLAFGAGAIAFALLPWLWPGGSSRKT